MDENKMTQTGERLLTVDNLKTTFMIHKTKVEAVRGASIHVDDGDILAVVGESGSGKSVLMKSIMGLLSENAQTTADSLVYMGRNLLEFSADERRKMRGKEFAMIFQDPMTALNPLKKIGAHLTEVLMRYRKLNKKQAREEAIEALRKVGIPSPEKRLDQYPHEFSGGMRQRVLIAMALCCKPKLLIADEPTTALDVTIQDQILRQLRELDKEYGASIIFITHDLGVVAELCDRVLVMYGGLIMEEARIEDIFERPGHPYTMGLLHSIPDVEQEKSERLEPIPGSPPDMTNPPAGCPFAPRCSYARKVCAGSLPDFVEVGEGHRTRCFLQYEDAPADEHNPFRGRNR